MKKLIIAAIYLGFATSAAAQEYQIGDLNISDPVVRATPVNAPVSGGYMTISNTGVQTDRLMGVSVTFAGKTEIHEMKMDGDVMKMREVDGGLEIPAGETIMLKPGGFHVMFMKMTQQLKQGEEYDATLTFEKAGDLQVTLNVEQLATIRENFAKTETMDHSGHGDMKMEKKAE